MLTVILALRLSFNSSFIEALVQSGQKAFSIFKGEDGYYFLRCTEPGATSTQIRMSEDNSTTEKLFGSTMLTL